MVKLQASGNKGRKDPVISIYFCITKNSSAAILGVLLDQHKLFVPAREGHKHGVNHVCTLLGKRCPGAWRYARLLRPDPVSTAA